MVWSTWFLISLEICSTAFAASLHQPIRYHGIGPRDTVSAEINAFVSNLSLSSSQAQSLESTYSGDSDLVNFLSGKNYSQTALTSLACYTAGFVLGSDSVDQPVSAAEADENWSVFFIFSLAEANR